jgi:putative serine protease PepD
VTAIHRTVSVPDPASTSQAIEISDTVQTNALIDAGTSGGPLLNVGGQVIGLAMQSQPQTGTSGFGLNIADIQDDVQQILQTGQVLVSSLGATGTDLSPEMASVDGAPEGSQLVGVDRAGPAAAAGLQTGDVITQIDDVKLDAAHPLRLLLRSRFHPNQRVTVTYSRQGSSTQVQVTLGSQHPTCA